MSDKIMHASKVGFPCDRNLWYSVNEFKENISLRSQRIFDVGTFLEPLVVEWLRRDGWIVDYNPGSQNADREVVIPVQGGVLSGHYDAIMWKDFYSPLILVDIKTMNDRAFTHWKRSGTCEEYPQYVDQLHVYAGGYNNIFHSKITKLGIVGVNKNNSDFHIDFFDYDEMRLQKIIKRAEKTFCTQTPPDPGERMQDWCCNYCGYSYVCELAQKKADTNVGDKIKNTKNPEIISAIEMLYQARKDKKAAEELEDDAKQFLDEYVRVNGFKSLRGGNFVLSITKNEKTKVDEKLLKEQEPYIYNAFLKTTSYVTYKVKEG